MDPDYENVREIPAGDLQDLDSLQEFLGSDRMDLVLGWDATDTWCFSQGSSNEHFRD